MNSLSSRIAFGTLLLMGLAAPSAAQEEPAPRQQQAEAPPPAPARQAVPRASAPRSQPAANAPAREERAAARDRGTDTQGRVRAPRARDSGQADSGRRGEPRDRSIGRAPAPPATTIRRPEPRRESPPPAAAPTASASAPGEEQRRAVPRGNRSRGDNRAVGRAEPRDGRYYPRDRRDGRVFTSRGRIYNNYYYYYPRRWYPYGYGAFGGLGYFYYDPYTWYSYDPYWSRPHYYSGSYGAYYRGSGDYDTGELRLQVVPRHAEVYVDGYFAGHVDDFDGMFQALRLEEGPYKIEIVAPGFETLVIDVRIQPGRKTTFRGELRPLP